MKTVDKILIIRFSSIGDIILTTPLLRELKRKYSDIEIHYLTKKKYEELLKYNKNINKLISYDEKNQKISLLIKSLKKEKYNLIVDLHSSLRSKKILRAFFFSFGVKILRYKKYTFKRFLLTKLKINLFRKTVPIVYRYMKVAYDYLHIKLKNFDYEIPYPETYDKDIDKELNRIKGFSSKRPLVALCPSASHETKKWGTMYLVQIVEYLIEKYNVQVALLGGEKEISEVNLIQSLVKYETLNLVGKLNLLQTAALLKKSRILVCYDTGIMHLAQSQNIPTLAIFGPTVKEFGFFPIRENCMVVQKEVKCKPCSFHGLSKCPKIHHLCMRSIKVEEVEKAIDNLLKL